MTAALRGQGIRAVALDIGREEAIRLGKKYVHNDICFPAQIVIGEILAALESGKYDPDKIALMITQTGGGCRASNYIHLLRKALKKSGYDHVPVISLNFAGMEKNPGFKLTPPCCSGLSMPSSWETFLCFYPTMQIL